MRLLTVIVLMLLLFFSGVTYGLFESAKSIEHEKTEETIEANEQEELVDEQAVEEELKELEVMTSLPETEISFVHKCAAFLEKICSSSYELVLKVLYYIASLFF